MTPRPTPVLPLRRRAAFVLISVLTAGARLDVAGQNLSVVGTLHNLSVSGPGVIRSTTETEVCKFCHIPHSAVVPQPLWGHALSSVNDYRTPVLRSRGGGRVPAPQPDGSSRLCLSCHDGTVALAEIAGRREAPDPLASQRLVPGQRSYIGTDLTGSHPVSIVPQDAPGADDLDRDMGVLPLATIQSRGDARLDADSKIQCTTCHDPHSDAHYREGRVPHFWVKPTVSEVCLACHEPR